MESPIVRVDGEALEYKVLVLGSSEVGKSSLIRRYTTGKFPPGMLSTIGRYLQKVVVSILMHFLHIRSTLTSLSVFT